MYFRVSESLVRACTYTLPYFGGLGLCRYKSAWYCLMRSAENACSSLCVGEIRATRIVSRKAPSSRKQGRTIMMPQTCWTRAAIEVYTTVFLNTAPRFMWLRHVLLKRKTAFENKTKKLLLVADEKFHMYVLRIKQEFHHAKRNTY